MMLSLLVLLGHRKEMLLLARQRVEAARQASLVRFACVLQRWWRRQLPDILQLRHEVHMRLQLQQDAVKEAAARGHMAMEERATRAFDTAEREAQAWERSKMAFEEAEMRWVLEQHQLQR